MGRVRAPAPRTRQRTWVLRHKVLTGAGILVLAWVAGAVVQHAAPVVGPTAPPARSSTSSSPVTPSPVSSSSGTPPAAQTAPPPAGSALALLGMLRVGGRSPMTGYARAIFGQAWADVDRNGCDTRDDVLRRDLTAFVIKAGTRGCVVLRGTLRDPYTGRAIAFVRGQGTSSAVQIDHVVALGDAWQKGAAAWAASERTAFANDPLNLLAVDGPTNQRKGDGDAATWLPPATASRCAYVARQVAVKARYGLRVTAAERDAVARVLHSCPGQPLPVAGPVALGGGRTEGATPSTPSPATTAAPRTTPGTSSGTDPRFGTCREATAHGYGDYRRGVDPEYDWYVDRDHDGIVCER